MANKRKILDNARKLAQKGAKEKALREYQKLLKLDPADAKLRLEIGDAHRRWGQIDEAIATYEGVASQYAKEGFDARAVAVYKQIITLDGEYLAAYEPLAEIYERMGLRGEALGALQTAADGLNRQGSKNRALDLLRRMATMDPTNTTSRIKVAELLRQEGREGEAIAEYESAARELESQGDLEAAGRAYVAVLEISPDHLEATKGVTRSMMAQNVPDKAVACARRVLKLAPDEVEHYELLATALRAAGQDDELSGVYRGLAELYRQRGDEERAREITQRFVSPDALAMEADLEESPGTPMLEEAPSFGEGTTSFGDDLIEGGGEIDEELLDGAVGLDDDLMGDELIEDDEAISVVDLEESIEVADPEPPQQPLRPAPGAAPKQAQRPAEQAPPPADPAPQPAASEVPANADPEQLLAEASVYLRYGKQDRAISHLEAVLQQNPHHLGALEKLGEACVEVGDHGRAVETWTTAARCAKEQGAQESFELLRARIGSIDADAAAALAPDDTPEAPDFAEDEGGEIEIDIDLDTEDEDELSLEDSSAAPDATPVATPVVAERAGASASGAPAADGGGSLSSTTSQQIADDLEEAEFYVQQNLLDEAEAIYKRVLAVAPSHPTALVRLGELAAAQGEDPNSTGSGHAQAAPLAPDEEMEIDVDDVEFEDDAGFASAASEAEIELDVGDEAAPMLDTPGLDAGLDAGLEEELDDDSFELADEPEEPEDFTAAPAVAAAPEPEPVAAPDPVPAAPPEPASGIDLVAEIGGFEDDPSPLDPDDSFDLAAELSDALGDSVAGASGGSEEVDDGFSAVFSAFKKGVSETLTEGDHQAHYDLGIAYKEMGLYDDAIGEFRAAMRDVERRPECLHLMGLCALDGGTPAAAVEHLKELLACPDVRDEAALAAQYDIGRAYAALGDVSQAKLAYQSVRALDPGFRDVGQLLNELGASSTGTAAPAASPPDGAGLESFEEFLEDEDDALAATASNAGVSGTQLDAGALAEAAAEAHLDAPSVLGDDGYELEEEPEASAPDLELESEAEVEPEPEPAPEVPRSDGPAPAAPKRRKKKISFV